MIIMLNIAQPYSCQVMLAKCISWHVILFQHLLSLQTYQVSKFPRAPEQCCCGCIYLFMTLIVNFQFFIFKRCDTVVSTDRWRCIFFFLNFLFVCFYGSTCEICIMEKLHLRILTKVTKLCWKSHQTSSLAVFLASLQRISEHCANQHHARSHSHSHKLVVCL